MSATAGMPLAVLEQATRMLAECRTVDEAKKIRDLAEAARVYAREADLGEQAMQHAAEIKLRAERRCGSILAEMAEQGTRATAKDGKKPNDRPSLGDLGIEAQESSRWQKLADADEIDFESYIAEAKEAGTPITTTGAVRYLTPAEQKAREDSTAQLFTIYRALEALATFDMTPRQWARLDHGSSRYRVDEHLERAGKWIDGLREQWQTT